jgi:hypothetical protein
MVELDPLPVVVAFAAVLLAFLAGGSFVNRRRAGTMANTVKPAFLALGPTRITWLGRAAFRYDVDKPKGDFVQVAALVQLLPRDLPFSWAVAALMGRRDMMSLRASLRRPPKLEFEAFVDEGYVGKRMREALRATRWPIRKLGDGPVVVAAAKGDLEAVERRLGPLGEVLERLWRLSASKVEPHLTANFDPSGPPEDLEARMEAIIAVAGALVAD